jgi:programmed cell death 6-interacting protein
MQAKDGKEFGEEIARLKHAKELMLAADSRGGQTFIFADVQKRIVRALQDAEKDNDFIYHARIPEVTSLTPITKAVVAKSTPVSTPMSQQFKDLFDKVVPLAVQQALMMFENRKSEILNMEIGRLREATQLLNSVLASLNLPAAIEDLSGGGGVPQSVLEKAATVRDMGGFVFLSHLINELPLLLQRNKEILDESMKLLDEEQQSDQQLRAQWGERWSRTPSERLTETIRTEGARYRQIIDNAVNADGIVRDRYSQHRAGFELLSKSDGEIESSIPSAKPAASLRGLPVVNELQDLMRQVGGIKTERDRIEEQIKNATFDMAPRFIRALKEDGAIDEERISTEQLSSTFSPLRELISESIHQQEVVLGRVQTANMEFVQAAGQNQSAVTRDQKLKDLAAAYDSFTELKANLEEGTKFYNDLTQLLVKFQSKVSDFCFARKTEKDELMKDLSANIARQPGGPPPVTPNYQQSPQASASAGSSGDRNPPVPAPRIPPRGAGSATGDQSSGSSGDRVPPPRPPPPKAQAASQAPIAQQQTPANTAPAGGQHAPQNPPYAAQPVAQQSRPAAPPPAGYGQQAPYPTYTSSMPYPVAPPTYAAPMPMGYNPYMSYQPPGQHPPGAVGGYPGYPGYPVPQQQPAYPGYPGQYPQQPQQYGQPQAPYAPGYPQQYPQQYGPR